MGLIFGLISNFIGMLTVIAGLFLLVIVGVPYYLGPADELQKADAIVALSGGDTEARTAEAITLYQQGWAPSLIFSGAAKDLKGPSNAEVMRRSAIAAGVPAEKIEIDKFGADTIGNAEGTTQIIRSRGDKRIILVTSKYHQRRAWLEFKKLLGSEVAIVNHPTTHDHRWPTKSWWLHPDTLWLGFVETIKTTYVWVRDK